MRKKEETKTKQTKQPIKNKQQPYNLEDYRKNKQPYAGAKTNPYRDSKVTREPLPRESKPTKAVQPIKTAQPKKRVHKETVMQEPRYMREQLKKKNKLSPKQKARLKKRYQQRMAARLAMLACAGLILSYGAVKLIDYVTYPSISYQPVRQGIIDNTHLLEGLIIRDEKTVKTTEKGDIHYVVGEGEKVAKGGDICFITDDYNVETTLQQMDKLDQSIYSMQDKRNELSYFQSEIHQLNLDIADEMKQFYYTKYWEQPHVLYNKKKALERTIQSRTSIYMNDETEVTEAIQQERKALQEQLKEIYSAYDASESGIISYQIDGLEDVLTPQVAQQMRYADYRNVEKAMNKKSDDRVQIDSSADTNNKETPDTVEGSEDKEVSNVLEGAEDKEIPATSEVTPNEETPNASDEKTPHSAEGTSDQENTDTLEVVPSEATPGVSEPLSDEGVPHSSESTADQATLDIVVDKPENADSAYPLYKMIRSYDWQVVTYIDTEEAASYEAGKQYPLYFNNHIYKEPILFTLLSKTEEDKRTKLVFESGDKMGAFLDTRFVSFSIGKNRETGLKIPLKSIVEKNRIGIPAEYIVEENNQTGVYRKAGEQVLFVPIEVEQKEIIDDQEIHYILQQIDNSASVQLGQTLKHPIEEKMYTVDQIETVQGVYTINASYAKFKKVEVIMTNEAYAILSSDDGTQLKEFDQIISNPKNIKEEELIRYMNIKN